MRMSLSCSKNSVKKSLLPAERNEFSDNVVKFNTLVKD